MCIELHVEPKTPPMTWEEYKAKRPGNSVALDGFVSGPPQKEIEDPRGPWANFNHHEGCDRLATRCTAMQVLMAQRQGFTETFRSTGSIPLYVDCGDCDEDIDVAEYLLENPHLTRNTMNPRLNRLVHMVDMLDSTAGSYAFPGDLPMMGQLAWIFDPYRRFRTSGEIDKKDADSYRAIIKEVGTRIRDHLLGCGDSIDLDPEYKRIGGGKGWVMIREIGAQAKMGMFADGHTAYLSVRERPDGRFTYVAGKTAFAKLNLPRLFDRLNELEGCPDNDQWGGGDLVGGSPRVAGSSLSPDRVGEVIDETVH